jgi:hypothetical protein
LKDPCPRARVAFQKKKKARPMSTRREFAVIAFLMMHAPGFALAEDALMGTYRGAYEVSNNSPSSRGGVMDVHVIFEITRVEGDVVGGTWILGEGACRGEYKIEGTLRDGVMALETAPGVVRGCGGSKIHLRVADGKLAGKFGWKETLLSR